MTVRSCLVRGVIFAGLVVLTAAMALAAVYYYNVYRSDVLQSQIALSLGLPASSDWPPIQRAVLCDLTEHGRSRPEIESELAKLGPFWSTADLDGRIIQYYFREPRVADHIGLVITYDDNGNLQDRTMLAGGFGYKSDFTVVEFDCSGDK